MPFFLQYKSEITLIWYCSPWGMTDESPAISACQLAILVPVRKLVIWSSIALSWATERLTIVAFWFMASSAPPAIAAAWDIFSITRCPKEVLKDRSNLLQNKACSESRALWKGRWVSSAANRMIVFWTQERNSLAINSSQSLRIAFSGATRGPKCTKMRQNCTADRMMLIVPISCEINFLISFCWKLLSKALHHFLLVGIIFQVLCQR